MRRARAFERGPVPRLYFRDAGDRREWWTETVGRLPPVYGERWTGAAPEFLRAFDPSRSKLAAALARGWDGPLPRPGETWLYLGAASGTTASHVADLVGPSGTVFAVEKSPRPFAKLLEVAARWPNLLPVLDDAREPEGYADLVAPVDGIYADVSQPDQVGLLLRNAELFLDPEHGVVLLALKTPSLGRERGPSAHLRAAEEVLARSFELADPVRLEPFHRGHFLVGGERTRADRRRGPEGTRPRAASGRPERPWRAPRGGRRGPSRGRSGP